MSRVWRSAETSGHAGRNGEGGFAITTVMFLAMAILLVTMVVVMRGFSQGNVQAGSVEWEQAIHVAESGLDSFMVELSAASNPATLATGQLQADLASKTDVIDAAEAMVASSPSLLTAVPDGEFVVVKPLDANRVYSVGAVPSWTDARRKIRVAELEYGWGPASYPNWTSTYAVLAGNNLDISGSALIQGTNADVHANGSLAPGALTRVSGCGTESVDSGYYEPGCPPSPAPEEPIPVIDARSAHHLSWYDLCPDGAHFGPAHPTSPSGVIGQPCSGTATANPTGWSGGGDSWSVNGIVDGVYFVYGADVGGRPGQASGSGAGPATITILAETAYSSTQDPTACPPQGTGGGIHLNAQSRVTAHSSTVANPGEPGLALIAEGDVFFNGGMEISGLVMAKHEFNMNGSSVLNGSLLVADRCAVGAVILGDMVLNYLGDISTPFDGTTSTTTEFLVLDRSEM